MSIKVSCPSCAKRAAVPDSFAGKRCRCPSCGAAIEVPATTMDAPAQAEPTKSRPEAEESWTPTKPMGPKRPVPKPLLTVGRCVLVLVIGGAAAGGYFLVDHYRAGAGAVALGTAWETENKQKIMAMDAKALTFAEQKKTLDAFEEYDRLLDLLNGQSLQDPEIIGVFQSATTARRALGAELIQAKGESGRTAASTPRAIVATTRPTVASTRPVAEGTLPASPAIAEVVKSTPVVKVEETPKPPLNDTVKPPATAPIEISLASTRPVGSQDEAARLRDVLNSLLQQGTNALAAGEYPAALDALQDAKQLFEKKMRGKSLAVGSQEHIALMHGLALAYQLVQKPERASPLFENNSPLDRVCNSKGASRQILITRATLDATQGYLAMRTVVSLSTYLKEHPDELDSELLDLLFTSLQKADERVNNRQLMLEPAMKLYESFNARLEATRSGLKRWGVQWVSAGEFATNMARRQSMIAAYDAAQRRADKALESQHAAEASLESAKKAYGNRAGITAAANRLDRAANDRVAADKAAAVAYAAIPPVPGLTKDDFRRILTPHDVEVLASKSSKSAGGAAADGTSHAVVFSLGGNSTPTTAVTSGTGPEATVPTYVPAAAPPSRRTFTRCTTGFSVGPDLLLTTSAAVQGAARIVVEFPNSPPIDAVVERVGDGGLALLRVKGQKLNYLNLADQFAGGTVQCMAFPEVSVFGIVMETLSGKAVTPHEQGWKVALSKHPRLPGAPLLDEAGGLIGIEMGERDDLSDRLPALSFSEIKAFLGADLPAGPCPNPKGAAIVQITAAFER